MNGLTKLLLVIVAGPIVIAFINMRSTAPPAKPPEEPKPLTADQQGQLEDLRRVRSEQAQEARLAANRAEWATYEKKCQYGYKVLDVTEEGCRITPFNSRSRLDYENDAFIVGLDGLSDRSYEGPITLQSIGELRYTTTLGGTRVIPQFRLVPHQDVLAKERFEEENNRKLSDARDAKRRAKETQSRQESEARLDAKKAAQEVKIIEALEKRITDGSADAAWDLGNRYLNGQGVIADVAKARSLIGLAAQRGNQRAKDWLLKTQPPTTQGSE